jgi:hypothetical protein
MNIKELYHKYIHPSELPLNRSIIREIAEIELIDLETKKGKIKKAVLYFRAIEGKQRRGIILNQTQVDVLCGLCGSDNSDDWIGKKVALSVKWLTVGGDNYQTFVFSKPENESDKK